MPIYDYVCSACDRRIEVIHSVHGPGPTTCEACGGMLRKALSTPAIHFKGSGWAKMDARSSAASAARSNGKPADDAAPATDASGAPGSSDTAATPAGSTPTASTAAPAASTPAAPTPAPSGGTGG